MGDILAIVEQRGGAVRGTGLEVLTAATGLAKGLGGACHALVIGGSSTHESLNDLARFGAEKIRVAVNPALDRYTSEGYLSAATQVAEGGDYAGVVLAATSAGKDKFRSAGQGVKDTASGNI